MKLIITALVLLAACHLPTPSLTADERAAGHAALAGWRAAGLPEPDRGNCIVSRFQVHLADAQDFLFRCNALASAAAGCLNWTSDDDWFRPESAPIVVISPAWKSEPGIVIHELMHAYTHCAELPTRWTPENYDHKDPRVWAATGGKTSAQARALAILAGQP